MKTPRNTGVTLTEVMRELYPPTPRPPGSYTAEEYAKQEGIRRITAQSRLQRAAQKGVVTRGYIPGTGTKWYAPVVGAKK